MALTDASKVSIALKKTQGKAQTKTENELYNEQFVSGLSLASKTIFAVNPSTSPNAALNSVTDNAVEKVRFVVEYITGSDTANGRHAFKLKLPANYESTSNSPNKATGAYVNSAELVTSGGRLQLVSPQFGDAYIAKAYYGSPGSLVEIPIADPRDWVLDYFNGVFFQEDPPTDVTHNPTFIDAYLYVGEYLDQRLASNSSSSSAVATGFDRYVKRITSTIAALTNVTFTGLDTSDVPADASISVFLNGDLLLEGNQTTTTAFSNADPRIPSATNTHFFVSGTSTLQFGFALNNGDHLVIEKHSFIGTINPRSGLVADTSGTDFVIDVEYSGASTSVIKSATDGTGITVDEANDFLLVHDATDNVVKYIKPNQLPSGDITGVTAGTGLTGGGSSGAITLNVADLTVSEIAPGSLTTSGESFADNDTSLMTSAAINDLIESKGYTTETGDITGVTAGTGLTGGGDSGAVTLNVADLTVSELADATLTTSGESFADNDTTLMTSAAINDLIESKGYTTEVGDITAVTAGVGLSGGGNSGAVTVDVDINGLPAMASLDHQDIVAIADVDDSNAVKKISVGAITEFQTEWSSSSAYGIDAFNGRLYLKPGDLGTAAAIDPANDTIIIDDASDSSSLAKKTGISDLITAVGGTGLTATNGVLSVSGLTVAQLHADTIQTSGESFGDNDTSVMTSAAINDLIESKGYTTVSGDVTAVVAGAGLATGGTSGDVTVDIDYAGADSIIKSATDGTAITVDENNDLILLHDATDNTVKYVKAGQVGSTSGGTIGAAEDGDYTDGLFSNFTSSTTTGTAIDKINEVLKLLAPGPAPDVASINTTNSNGISAKLSFGASNSGGSTYIDSANSAGMTPIDTNGTYAPVTQGTSERLGIYTSATTIEGIVNHDVGQDKYANNVVNYVADSFGNGELGTLKLFVNNMSTPVHSVNLASFTGSGNPGSGTATSFTSNSGFYAVSITKDATSEGGTAFDIFKHRTAKYRIHPNHQREGWNYARVVHTLSTGDKTTNYIEWVNDTDTTAISAASTSISSVVGSNEFVLSGIKYFRTSSFNYATTISNAHRALHTSTPIVFNSTYGSITTATDQNSVNLLSTFPSVESGEDFTKTINITASGTFNVASSGFPAGGLLNGSNTVSINITHPRTSKNQTGLASASVSNLLMYYPTAAPTALFEDFNSETWRQQSGAYNTQASVYTSGAFVTPWNSATKVNSADAGHNTGLVQYQGQLRAPRNTLLNGNFASVTNGPSSNANYSTITSGTREYIRAFKKTSAGTVRDLRLTLAGSASIIANDSAFPNNANAIKVFVKVPGSTGWMDLAGAFVLGSDGDNDGAHVSTYTSNISGSVHNYVSFGLDTIGQNDHVLVKIQADATWTGNLSAITVKFGASSGAETSVPDNCTSINSTTSNGINAKLSFGAAQSIPASDANHPYTNVAGANSLANVNINNAYTAGGNRKGIYNGTAILTGIVNSGEAGDSGNFAAHAIRYGNEGVIKLFVNDAEKHSVNLASYGGTGNPGSGVAQSVNGAGSGFSNISTAQYVTWSDGIPDYRYNVRTMNWRVVAADQRPGHNWVRVVHSVSGTDYTTNYIEWVNDPNGDSVTFSNVNLANFTDSDTSHLSGIEYFNSPSTTFKYRVSNMHRNIYDQSNTALGFIGLTNVTISNLEITGAGVQDPADVNSIRTSVPALLTNSDTNYTLPMDVTGSFNYTPTKTLPGTYGTSANNVTISAKAYHPISNASGAAQSASKSNFLVWTPTQSGSSNQQSVEDFSGEAYRLEDSTFATTTDITNKTWDSTQSLVGNGSGGNAGHNTGLCIYNGNLIPPSQAGSSGDFSTGLQGPSGNVNYSLSNVTNNTRTYLRAFYNPNAGDSASNIILRLTGTASLKSDGGPSNAGTLGNNTNIHIKVKLVYHSAESTKTTGWLDAGEQATGGNADGAGCSGEALSDLNVVWNNNTQTVQINHPTGRGLYGTSSPFNRNYVIIKIETHKQWTGKFTDMRITSYN